MLLTVSEAVSALRRGQLVVFPTETVYGLGADASNAEAIAALYQAKGRPTGHPVIVHIGASEQLAHWAATVPPFARALAEAFWPGPLTLILPRAAHVLDAVTGGQPTVGIRMPSHPVALELLQAFGGGVVAPSANRFGQLSPTRVETLDPALLAHVAGVLAGGPCTVGVESTIVDCTGAEPVVLRPGMIDTARLEAVLGQPVRSRQQVAQQETVSRVPGDLPSHYAPRTPLVLVDDLTARLTQSAGRRVGGVVVAGDAVPQGEHWIVLPADAEGYARELYAALAALDQQGLEEIWVAVPPVGVAWEAVHDRLRRAAAPRPGVHHMVVSVGGGDPS